MGSTRARRTAEEIVAAVAESARQLFVERGPAAVSLRDVAAAAEVNLGLIHRYVGSKDDVVALVLDRHGEAASAALARTRGLDALLDLLAASPPTASGRLFAGILLADIDALQLKREFPVAGALTAALDEEGPSGDPAVTAALLQSLVLGWEIFSPFLLGAAGVRDAPDERAVLRRALHALLHHEEPSNGQG